jgi:hypothetical protein
MKRQSCLWVYTLISKTTMFYSVLENAWVRLFFPREIISGLLSFHSHELGCHTDDETDHSSHENGDSTNQDSKDLLALTWVMGQWPGLPSQKASFFELLSFFWVMMTQFWHQLYNSTLYHQAALSIISESLWQSEVISKWWGNYC